MTSIILIWYPYGIMEVTGVYGDYYRNIPYHSTLYGRSKTDWRIL